MSLRSRSGRTQMYWGSSKVQASAMQTPSGKRSVSIWWQVHFQALGRFLGLFYRYICINFNIWSNLSLLFPLMIICPSIRNKLVRKCCMVILQECCFFRSKLSALFSERKENSMLRNLFEITNAKNAKEFVGLNIHFLPNLHNHYLYDFLLLKGKPFISILLQINLFHFHRWQDLPRSPQRDCLPR